VIEANIAINNYSEVLGMQGEKVNWGRSSNCIVREVGRCYDLNQLFYMYLQFFSITAANQARTEAMYFSSNLNSRLVYPLQKPNHHIFLAL